MDRIRHYFLPTVICLLVCTSCKERFSLNHIDTLTLGSNSLYLAVSTRSGFNDRSVFERLDGHNNRLVTTSELKTVLDYPLSLVSGKARPTRALRVTSTPSRSFFVVRFGYDGDLVIASDSAGKGQL